MNYMILLLLLGIIFCTGGVYTNQVLSGSQNVTCIPGQTVKFNCSWPVIETAPNQTQTLQWMFVEESTANPKILSSRDFSSSELLSEKYTVENYCVLTVVNASKQDAGKYVCMLTNSSHSVVSVSTSHLLVVEQDAYLPAFDWMRTSPNVSQGVVGSPLVLECHTKQNLSIHWLMDNHTFVSNSSISIVDNKLVIRDLSWNMNGSEFMCSAGNHYGDVAHSIIVNVEEKSQKINLHLNAEKVNESSFIVTWSIDQCAENDSVSLMLKIKNLGDSEWKLTHDLSLLTENSFSVTGLDASTNYLVNMTACSRKCNKTDSVWFIVVTDPFEISFTFINVNKSGLKVLALFLAIIAIFGAMGALYACYSHGWDDYWRAYHSGYRYPPYDQEEHVIQTETIHLTSRPAAYERFTM